MKNLMIYFSAGCIGALTNRLVLWLLGEAGIPQSFNIAIAPALTPEWLYPAIVWGGLWGLAFISPFLNSRILLKGSVLSLLPSLVQIFIVFPYKLDAGIGGMDLGQLTPAYVVLVNWIWGIVTAASIKLAR